MTILKRLRNQPQPESRATGSGQESATDGHDLPIRNYDGLDGKGVTEQLVGLSQVDLDSIQAHELAHKDRPAVRDKLRYLRGSEPLPGYDALDAEEVAQALAGADASTVRAVRDYERRSQHRQSVTDAVTRILPTSPVSAGDDRARDEKVARVQEGFAGRAKATNTIAGGRPTTDGTPDA